jgi:class 3 adenylate cyclase
MESCAPSGGILVTESTFALLKSEYNFKPGKLVRVKGKGQVVSYFLLGRKGQES